MGEDMNAKCERVAKDAQAALVQLKANVEALQRMQLAIEYFKRAKPECEGCKSISYAHSVQCLNFAQALKILKGDQ
jgi:hypothetical protein